MFCAMLKLDKLWTVIMIGENNWTCHQVMGGVCIEQFTSYLMCLHDNIMGCN